VGHGDEGGEGFVHASFRVGVVHIEQASHYAIGKSTVGVAGLGSNVDGLAQIGSVHLSPVAGAGPPSSRSVSYLWLRRAVGSEPLGPPRT